VLRLSLEFSFHLVWDRGPEGRVRWGCYRRRGVFRVC